MEMTKTMKFYNDSLDIIEEIQDTLDTIKSDLREAAYKGDTNELAGILAYLVVKKERIINEITNTKTIDSDKYGPNTFPCWMPKISK